MATTFRVGVRFEKVPRGAQSELDRFVFALMKRKARAKARESLPPGAERRVAPRVEIGVAEDLQVEHLPDRPLGALAARSAQPNPRFKVKDISTTGLALFCDDFMRFKPRTTVRFRLVGEGIDVELSARVIHVLGAQP